MILKFGMYHWGLKLYKVYINDDPGLTLTYFTVNFMLSFAFSVLNNNDGRHVYQSNSLMQGSPSVPYVQIEYDVPVHMEGTDMQPYSKIRLETIDDRTISSIEGNKPEQMSRNLEQEVCRICGDSASGLLSCVHCSSKSTIKFLKVKTLYLIAYFVIFHAADFYQN